MLTLLETISAIKALDTAPDVIKSACAKLLAKEDEIDFSDSDDVGKQILRDYIDRVDNIATLISACIQVAANLSAQTVRPGHESQLISVTATQFRHTFVLGLQQRVAETSKTNPAAADEHMKAMLQGLIAAIAQKK